MHLLNRKKLWRRFLTLTLLMTGLALLILPSQSSFARTQACENAFRECFSQCRGNLIERAQCLVNCIGPYHQCLAFYADTGSGEPGGIPYQPIVEPSLGVHGIDRCELGERLYNSCIAGTSLQSDVYLDCLDAGGTPSTCCGEQVIALFPECAFIFPLSDPE